MAEIQLMILNNAPTWLVEVMRYYCFFTAIGLSLLAGYQIGKNQKHKSN